MHGVRAVEGPTVVEERKFRVFHLSLICCYRLVDRHMRLTRGR